jgi:hypothetical protein
MKRHFCLTFPSENYNTKGKQSCCRYRDIFPPPTKFIYISPCQKSLPVPASHYRYGWKIPASNYRYGRKIPASNYRYGRKIPASYKKNAQQLLTQESIVW